MICGAAESPSPRETTARWVQVPDLDVQTCARRTLVGKCRRHRDHSRRGAFARQLLAILVDQRSHATHLHGPEWIQPREREPAQPIRVGEVRFATCPLSDLAKGVAEPGDPT